MGQILTETMSYAEARMIMEYADPATPDRPKDLYMKGIFIQGDIRNINERVYPSSEIQRAVSEVRESITRGYQVLGELDHPQELSINLPNVSHVITDMWMEGSNGMGKLKILATPMGAIARTILEEGIRLGVSSRGSGDVGPNGRVTGFKMTTVDIVARPSAPDAFPVAIHEGVLNSKRSNVLGDVAANHIRGDKIAQKYLRKEVLQFIEELKI